MIAFQNALPLYFQHIPKTAGTSVGAMLARAFPMDEICPVLHWDTIAALPRAHLDGYNLFVGHFASYLERFLGRKLNKFTLFRDPVERTVSHYLHILRNPGHPFHAQVKTQTLREFVCDPRTRANVENYQARYVADFGYDPVKIAGTFAAADRSAFPVQMYIDELSLAENDADLRARAHEALGRFFQIGVVENFAVEMRRLAETLGRPLGEPVRMNVSMRRSQKEDLDRATLVAILQATTIDRELYERVRDRAGDASPPAGPKRVAPAAPG